MLGQDLLTNMGGAVSSLLKSDDKQKAEEETDQWHYECSTVVEYFLQDMTSTVFRDFDVMNTNFGLIEQTYDTDKLLPGNGRDLTQWQRFDYKVKILNQKAPNNVSYRVLYLGRHGQGYHNVGSAFYGSEAWDCYYSTLENDVNVPSVKFFDASLTSLGEYQARQVNQFWRRMIAGQKIAMPERYYCSPHTRALQTARISFANLDLSGAAPFRPLIKELLRESHGIHTCDRRDTRTYLEKSFPDFDIEAGFSETDELYSADLREPSVAHTARTRRLFDDIMEHDKSTYISMTAHHGTISSIMKATGHRPFGLPTGGVIPVLVKVEKIRGPRPDIGGESIKWETKPACVNDPLKAGKPGYKDIGEYIKDIERNVPADTDTGS